MEKRQARRHGRRLKVRYGERERGFVNTGLTSDVSATGMFVLANSSPAPGTRLHLEVTLPGEVPVFVEGVVARQVIVPQALRQVVKSGFGFRYLMGTELVAELVPSLRVVAPASDVFTLGFDSASEWRLAWEREYSRGGAFVWSDRAVARNAVATLTFDLRFLKRKLSFEARVVHVLPSTEGRQGIALMFVDVAEATSALGGTLGGRSPGPGQDA
jgi:hypothetical protein